MSAMEHQQQQLRLTDLPDELLLKCLAPIQLADVLKLPPLCRRLQAVVARAGSVFEEVLVNKELGYCVEPFSLQTAQVTRFFQAHGAAIRRLKFDGGYLATVSDATGACTLAHTAWLVCALPYTVNLQSFTLRGPFDCAGMALLARGRRLEHLALNIPDDRALRHLPSLSGTLRSLYLDIDLQTTSPQAVSSLTALTELQMLHVLLNIFAECFRPLTALRSLQLWEMASLDLAAVIALPTSLTFLGVDAEDALPISATLGQCVGLRDLQLNADLEGSHERLEQLSTCTDLRSCRHLGSVGSTFPTALLHLTTLRVLDLSFFWSYDATIRLPDGITTLQRLRLLDLYHEELEGVELDTTFTAVTRLEVFALGDVEHFVVRSHTPGVDTRCLEAWWPTAGPAGRVCWSFTSPEQPFLLWAPPAHAASFLEVLAFLERRIRFTDMVSADDVEGLRAEIED